MARRETWAGASCRLAFASYLPGGLIDARARPLLLSFGLRRAPQGAGLVAAGAETSHSPLSSGAPAASELSSRRG